MQDNESCGHKDFSVIVFCFLSIFLITLFDLAKCIDFNYWSKGSSVAQTVECSASDGRVMGLIQGLHALIKCIP